MGEMYGVKCSKCDISFPINVGHGMLGCEFFEIDERTKKPYFYGYTKNEEIISDIERILDTWDDVVEDDNASAWRAEWFSHGSAQYLCQKCGCIDNNLYFALKGSGGKYMPEYSCSSCNYKVILIELKRNDSGAITVKSEKPVKWFCSNCDNDKLIIEKNAGHILYD